MQRIIFKFKLNSFTAVDSQYFIAIDFILFQYYDEEIAKIAQKWATHCPDLAHAHDTADNRLVPGKYSVQRIFTRKIFGER